MEEYTGLEKIDENNLFINRVSQSAYPIGGLLAPFFLNEDNDFDNINVSNFSFLDIFSDENCGIGVSEENETIPLIQNGCQSVVYLYARERSPNELKENPLTSTLFKIANVGLPVSPPVEVPRDVSWYDILLGSQPIRSNPYKIASLYSILSTGDKITIPFITSAVNTESGGWVVLPKDLQNSYTGEFNSEYISNILKMENIPGWEISAITRDDNGFYSWHITGTNSSWTGNPVLVVSVIEDNNREFVKYIGHQLFEAVVFDQDT